MAFHPKVRHFVLLALLVGVCLGGLSHYSEATIVKLSIWLPFVAADAVDWQYIVRSSAEGDAAFWLTLVVQWLVIGYGFSGLWLIARKKNDKTTRHG